MGWRVAYLAAAACVYLADQASKAWAVRRLRAGEVVHVVGNTVRLAYAENPGIAFGRLQEGGEFGRWMLAALAALAVVGLLAYLFRPRPPDDRLLGAAASASSLTSSRPSSARTSGRPSTSPTRPSAPARRCSRST